MRLTAGRRQLGEPVQALCFLAGANSIFYGDKLLTRLGLLAKHTVEQAKCGD